MHSDPAGVARDLGSCTDEDRDGVEPCLVADELRGLDDEENEEEDCEEDIGA